MNKVPIEVSARHCHLCAKDLARLFGREYKLKQLKKVSQPGQYSTKEEIMIKGSKSQLAVRIVAPLRLKTQVELAVTDCYRLGIKPVLRVSGHLAKTPGAILSGPSGQIKIKEGVIVAERHLHLSVSEAKNLHLKTGDLVAVKITGSRSLIFNRIVVRSGKEHKMALQIDTDEGNACGWKPGMRGVLLK